MGQTLSANANNLLHQFCKRAVHLYGKEISSYNVHSLTHIADDVENFGPLDTFSCFPFENYLGCLKRMLSKNNQQLQQICNRIQEEKNWRKELPLKPKKPTIAFAKRHDRPNADIKGLHIKKTSLPKICFKRKTK